LDGWRDVTEASAERMFHAIYGNPLLQAALGVDPARADGFRHAPRTALHRELTHARIEALKARIGKGGMRECLVRALLYIGMARGAVDERSFAAIRRLRTKADTEAPLSLADFKAL